MYSMMICLISTEIPVIFYDRFDGITLQPYKTHPVEVDHRLGRRPDLSHAYVAKQLDQTACQGSLELQSWYVYTCF